jgi:hypothetical protein
LKTTKTLGEGAGGLGLEYNDTRGTRNTIRLDEATRENAIHEAKLLVVRRGHNSYCTRLNVLIRLLE